MKVLNLKRFISLILFIFLLFCERYIPSYKINYSIQFLTLLFVLFSSRNFLNYNFVKVITPILAVFFLGFLGMFFFEQKTGSFVKDLTYFTKPIIVLCVSYFLLRKESDFKNFLKAVVLVGFSMAFIHFSGILLKGNFSESINDLRGSFGLDNFIEIVALYILLFYRKTYKSSLINSLILETVFVGVLLISIYLYFSRTMLVSLILMGLSVFGYTKITKKKLLFLGGFLIFLGFLYVYLFSVKIDRNAKGIEAFLYKVKIAPEEIFKTKIDRENHKDLWDHWRGYEAKRAFSLMNDRPISYITGNGFGSTVDLKFTAPLDEKGMRYISRLHNGYVFVLYKTGILGLFLYLYFIYLLIVKTNKKETSSYMTNRFIGSIGLFFLFTSLIISGIYIPIDLMLFLLGGFLSFSNREQVIVKAT